MGFWSSNATSVGSSSFADAAHAVTSRSIDVTQAGRCMPTCSHDAARPIKGPLTATMASASLRLQ
jgi:hypothetical protein